MWWPARLFVSLHPSTNLLLLELSLSSYLKWCAPRHAHTNTSDTNVLDEHWIMLGGNFFQTSLLMKWPKNKIVEDVSLQGEIRASKFVQNSKIFLFEDFVRRIKEMMKSFPSSAIDSPPAIEEAAFVDTKDELILSWLYASASVSARPEACVCDQLHTSLRRNVPACERSKRKSTDTRKNVVVSSCLVFC